MGDDPAGGAVAVGTGDRILDGQEVGPNRSVLMDRFRHAYLQKRIGYGFNEPGGPADVAQGGRGPFAPGPRVRQVRR